MNELLIDAVPPQSLEMEQAVLGAMLIEQAAVNVAKDILAPVDFYRDAHRIIFEAIIALDDRSEPIDPYTVQEEVRKLRVIGPDGRETDAMDAIGGAPYLVQLTDAIPTAVNVGHYARIVKERTVCRRLQVCCAELHNLVAFGDLSAVIGRSVDFNLSAIIDSFVEVSVPKTRLLRAGEFLASIGELPPMLVDDLIPDRSLVLFSGKPKAGKSLAVIDLLNSVCTGNPVFGRFPVNRPGPVVYIGMEDGAIEIANRLLKRGLSTNDERELYIYAERIVVNRREGIARLRKMIAGLNPSLLCLDSAREAVAVKDWMNPSEVADAVRPLREEIARQICPVLLISHNRKADGNGGDEISGTNAFTGAVDGWLSVSKTIRPATGARRLYLRVDGRGGMGGEFGIEMDRHTLCWRALTEAEMEETAPAGNRASVQSAILIALQSGTERTRADIVSELREHGISRDAIDTALIDLRTAGRIAHKKGERNADFYWLDAFSE